MKKLLILAAAGVGYVFGARAGRERYEQIRRASRLVKNDPRVQATAHQAADLAREKGPVIADKVTSAASSVASTVADKVTPGSDVGDQLNPDSTHFQKDPFPQGDLP